ncbi:MAG: thioredoxin family protein [Phycisphaerales bacterium]
MILNQIPLRPGQRWTALWTALALLVTACLATPAHAQGDSSDHVSVKAVPAKTVVAPGDTLPVAVVFDIAKGWHIWTNEAQITRLPAGMAAFEYAIFTNVTAAAEPAAAAKIYTDRTQWPAPHGAKADVGDGVKTYAVYEGKSVAFVPVLVDPKASAGPLKVTLKVTFQSCNESVCAQGADVTVPVELTVVAPGAAGAGTGANGSANGSANGGAADAALFAGFDPAVFSKLDVPVARDVRFNIFEWEFTLNTGSSTFLPVLLLMAFCGGILLNFTPCVLPIVPLKIMGLSAAAAGERKHTFMLGLAMSLGVVAFWMTLGVLLGTVKEFTQVNQFFQYPAFTITVGVFIAVMAVGMAGFYSLGLPQWVYAIEPKHETYGGSILFGVMTAVLSTPCTAPLMGAAAGWAVTTDSPLTVLSVFLSIGLGMASPYIVLSAFPHLTKKMPKTGPASDVLKQVMGLLLLAAAAYFIGAGINAFLDEPSKIYWWIISLIGGVAGVWLVIRTVQLAKSNTVKTVFVTTGLLIAVISGAIGPVLTYERLPWSRFTPDALAAAMKDGKVVVLDFTAEWCINCKALEKTVLESSTVAEALTQSNVVLLKADITGPNPAALEKMRSLGRATIPLLAVFAPDGQQMLNADTYTPTQVVDAVKAASEVRTSAQR